MRALCGEGTCATEHHHRVVIVDFGAPPRARIRGEDGPPPILGYLLPFPLSRAFQPERCHSNRGPHNNATTGACVIQHSPSGISLYNSRVVRNFSAGPVAFSYLHFDCRVSKGTSKSHSFGSYLLDFWFLKFVGLSRGRTAGRHRSFFLRRVVISLRRCLRDVRPHIFQL